MAKRVAVMSKGVLQQVGPPQDLYDRPANLFVARFIGNPPMNMLEVQLARSDGGLAVDIGGQRLALGDDALGSRPALAELRGQDRHRRDPARARRGCALCSRRRPTAGCAGEVVLTEALGSEIVAHISVDAKPAVTEDVRELAQDIGEDIDDEVEEGKATLVGRVDARSKFKIGEPAELTVDTGALHFFDPTRGRDLRRGNDERSQLMAKHRLHLLALVLLLMLAAFAAGCGGDDDDEAGGDTGAADTGGGEEAATSPAGCR